MKPTRPRYGECSISPSLGPQLGFAAAILAGLAAWAGLAAAAPAHVVMAVVATTLLAFAAGFGVIAWHRPEEGSRGVTNADVAGALTLVGLCAAATIDADQLVQIVTAGGIEH